MSATLYLCKDHSLLMLVPAGLLSSLVFVAMLFWLGAFSSSDLALAKEGLSFLRPFLEKWRSQLQRSAT